MRFFTGLTLDASSAIFHLGQLQIPVRRTYAYLLNQQGVHVTTAQRLLGHSDPRVTMRIYTQVLDNDIDDVDLILSKTAGF